MKNILLTIFLCFCFIAVQSQVNVMLFAGSSHGIDLNAVSLPGYNAGALLDIPINKSKWSLQTGLNINSVVLDNNSSIERYYDLFHSKVFDEGSINSYSFLELPLCVAYNIMFLSGSKMTFNTGIFMGIFTGGKSLLRSSTGFSDYAVETSYADPVNMGFLTGIGFTINRVYLGVEGNINVTEYRPEGVIKTKFGFSF